MTWSRSGSSKHARRPLTCPCGRVIYGNAFHSHKWKCSAWLHATADRKKISVAELIHDHDLEKGAHPSDCSLCNPPEANDG